MGDRIKNYYHDPRAKRGDDTINPYADENLQPLGQPLSITFKDAATAVKEGAFRDHQDNLVAFYAPPTEFCRVIHFQGQFFDYADGFDIPNVGPVAELPIPKFSR